MFGAASSYRPKISSLYGYGLTAAGAGAGGAGGDKDKEASSRKLVVEVNKYCANADYEGEVRLHVDRRGLLAKSRGVGPRRNVYFNTRPHLTLLEDNFDDIRGRYR